MVRPASGRSAAARCRRRAPPVEARRLGTAQRWPAPPRGAAALAAGAARRHDARRLPAGGPGGEPALPVRPGPAATRADGRLPRRPQRGRAVAAGGLRSRRPRWRSCRTSWRCAADSLTGRSRARRWAWPTGGSSPCSATSPGGAATAWSSMPCSTCPRMSRRSSWAPSSRAATTSPTSCARTPRTSASLTACASWATCRRPSSSRCWWPRTWRSARSASCLRLVRWRPGSRPAGPSWPPTWRPSASWTRLAPGALRRFSPYEAPALASAIRDAIDEATSGPDPRVVALAAQLATPRIVERYVELYRTAMDLPG